MGHKQAGYNGEAACLFVSQPALAGAIIFLLCGTFKITYTVIQTDQKQTKNITKSYPWVKIALNTM